MNNKNNKVLNKIATRIRYKLFGCPHYYVLKSHKLLFVDVIYFKCTNCGRIIPSSTK